MPYIKNKLKVKTMEEKKPKELSYEELKKIASDLHVDNQKMTAYIHKLQAALDDQMFSQTSFFVSMLFKVLEHPEMHSEEFVNWAAKKIEDALKSFDEVIEGKPEQEQETKEEANEAE